jgi:parvulin-like peptidyl-prolyl isomerase
LNRISNLFATSEVDPESRNRVMLIAGISGIVVIALALIAVGYYIDRVQPRGETVFTVGDRKFSYAYLEDRVDAANAEGRFNTSDLTTSIALIVSDIQNEELTRLIAREDGLTVTSEELDAGIRDDLGLSPEADHNIVASVLRSHLQDLGLSLGRFEEIVEAGVLQREIQDQISANLPAEMEQVNLSLIFTETDGSAATARQRIADGEAFEDVAAELSQHSSAADGGMLGWTPRELVPEAIAENAFTQEPGTLSDVIETENGFYVIKVDGKETRELEEAARLQLTRLYFGDRLEAAADQYQPQNLVTVGQARRLAEHLQSSGG